MCFDTKEECQFLIDALQKYYNFSAKKSYDYRKQTNSIIVNGIDEDRYGTTDITIAFYPNGDPWNEEAYCELLESKRQ